MKNYRRELWFDVPTRRAFINITPQVRECIVESGITEGLVLVNAMHITASVFVNDDESGLHQGILMTGSNGSLLTSLYRHIDTTLARITPTVT